MFSEQEQRLFLQKALQLEDGSRDIHRLNNTYGKTQFYYR
jgi:hypothetical protein